MNAVEEAARNIESEACHAIESVRDSLYYLIANADLPHVRMRPTLKREGNVWRANYGDVMGFGESPEKAMQGFDLSWTAATVPGGGE